MKWVASVLAAAVLLSGCAAKAGDTQVDLHQRVRLPDGTTYELVQFKMSEINNPDPGGAPKIPGNEVDVSVLIDNAGPAIRVGDLRLTLAYRDDRGQDITPPVVPAGRAVTIVGTKATVTTTFELPDNKDVFRTRYIRVQVERAGYPEVTFSGTNP